MDSIDILKIIIPPVLSAIITGAAVIWTVQAKLESLKEWTGAISKSLKELNNKVGDRDRSSLVIIGEIRKEIAILTERVDYIEREVEKWANSNSSK